MRFSQKYVTCLISQCPAQDATGIFWDNDSLAALLALEIQAALLILLSDVEGLYTGPPSEPKSQLIHTYLKEKHDDMVTFGAKSRVGRGGMTAKVYAAWQAASAGIPVIISRSALIYQFTFIWSDKILMIHFPIL